MTAPIVDLKSLHILVIDDEDFIRRLIARVLYELEINNVIEARDGSEALTFVKQAPAGFDAIICDLEMPKMNGIEFVRQLRADADVSKSQTPILILTGHSMEGKIKEVVELGIHGFLAKPVSKGTLEKRLIDAVTSPPIDPKVLNRG
jgi:two-component system chemotaxis response regulator CheY